MRVITSSPGQPETIGNPTATTGFPDQNKPHIQRSGATLEGWPRPAWISDALLDETVEVWSNAYGRPISEEEAVEILQNVKRLGEALLKAKREMS